MRRTNYRLVLPEGPLRRFRLPESFGDEVRGAKDGQPIPLMAALGWLGVCLCSWSLAAGVVDPAALFDKTWQLPSDESGRRLVAGVLAASNEGTHSPAASLQIVPAKSATPAGPTLRASRPDASHQLLPKVTFPDVQAHRGGWAAMSEGAGAAPPEPGAAMPGVMAPNDDSEDGVSARGAAASERAQRTAGGGDFNLGQRVRELVAGTPGLPRPGPMHSSDPFEADFGATSLPRLHAADVPDAPIALRPRDVPGGESKLPSVVDEAQVAVSGERGAVSWNGGCQRAFDASVQHIGDKPPAKDASRADYTRALGRLEVAACGPRAHTHIEVCVAVSAGRAVGATVHTTPSTPGLGECLMRKVRSLGFPASGGTDLVRTQYRVD